MGPNGPIPVPPPSDSWALEQVMRSLREQREDIKALATRVDALEFVRKDVYEARHGALIERVNAQDEAMAAHNASHIWYSRQMFLALLGAVASVVAVLAGAIK